MILLLDRRKPGLFEAAYTARNVFRLHYHMFDRVRRRLHLEAGTTPVLQGNNRPIPFASPDNPLLTILMHASYSSQRR